MTNREFAELKERLEKASDREISLIYEHMNEKDPFTDPDNRLLLPSVIRAKAISHIEALFRNGLLTAKKNG